MDNLKYPEYHYINWRKGMSYNCSLITENQVDIIDDKGIVFHFTGNAMKKLNKVFIFIDK